MITKETEAARFNEGKTMLSLIDFRMFSHMHEAFEFELPKCETDTQCIFQILYNVSQITAPENKDELHNLLPALQVDCYALSAFQLKEKIYNSKAYNLKVFEPMAQVLEYGSQKYARDNWRKGYVNRFSSADSLLRHTRQIILGEYRDEESGLPHIGHIMCNVMFLTNDLLYIKRE
jgi:hypothetical protein